MLRSRPDRRATFFTQGGKGGDGFAQIIWQVRAFAEQPLILAVFGAHAITAPSPWAILSRRAGRVGARGFLWLCRAWRDLLERAGALQLIFEMAFAHDTGPRHDNRLPAPTGQPVF
jgi:hypothetical protein